MNRFELIAQIDSLSALRYSPSGIPVLDFVLKHESSVVEADKPRQVQLKMNSIAMGTLADRLSRFELGSNWLFHGFLSSTKNMKSVFFHIQEIQSVL